MIRFGLYTYKARLHAMPCPPDEFQIQVTMSDKLDKRDGISPPVFFERGFYELTVSDCQFTKSTFLTYKRIPPPKKPNWSVHDLILADFHYESPR